MRERRKPTIEGSEPAQVDAITPTTARLLDESTDAAFLFDLRTDIIHYWSRSAERLYGWSKADALGKRCRSLLQTTFPEPFREMKAFLLHQRHWSGDLIHAKRDGTPVHVKSHWAVFQRRRSNPQCIEINVNISEQNARRNARISEQTRSLQMAYASVRELSNRLRSAQDEERRRIARELHDSTMQGLSLLGVNLSVFRKKVEHLDKNLANELSEYAKLAKQIFEDVRTMSYLLHPPVLQAMGFAAAVRWYVDGLQKRSNLRIHVDVPADFNQLPENLETALFRVVQEGLTNIYRHSGSHVAHVRLSRVESTGIGRGEIRLEIADEGRGIPAPKLAEITSPTYQGIGVRSIQERVETFGGTLEILSNDKGTRLNIHIPAP